jgi:hypothetical protein
MHCTALHALHCIACIALQRCNDADVTINVKGRRA